MITELFYLGRDNVNQLTVTDVDEQPVDFSGVTRMVMSFQGSDIILDSALHPEMIEWTDQGVVLLTVGALPITPSKYFATLVSYAPAYPDGQVVFHSAEGRVQAWFIGQGASGNDEDALDTLAERVGAAEDSIEDLQAADVALDARVDALEAADISLDGRVDTAEGALVSLDSRLDAAEPQLVSLDSRLDTAEPTLASLASGGATHAAAHAAMDLSIAEFTAATPAQLGGTVAKPYRFTVVGKPYISNGKFAVRDTKDQNSALLIGDSRIQIGDASETVGWAAGSTTSTGVLSLSCARAGVRPANIYNISHGGDTTTEQLVALQALVAAGTSPALKCREVVMSLGINDQQEGIPIATTLTNLDTILGILNVCYLRCLETMPTSNTTINGWAMTINNYLSNYFETYPERGKMYQVTGPLIDKTTTNGYLSTALTTAGDRTHANNEGNRLLVNACGLYSDIASVFPPVRFPQNTRESRTIDAKSAQLLKNPLFTEGTAGTAGAGITGTVPTGWKALCSFGSASMGFTQAANSGVGNKLVVTITASAAGQFTLYQDDLASKISASSVLQLVMSCKATTPGTLGRQGMQIFDNGTPAFNFVHNGPANSDVAFTGTEQYKHATRLITLSSYTHVLTASATAYFVASFLGAGTIVVEFENPAIWDWNF